MTNFITMKDRIEDEINRTDATTAVGNAINTAIRFYERTPFYFNQLVASGATTADDESLSPPDNLSTIISLKVSNGDTFRVVDPITYDEMEGMAVSDQDVGVPKFFSYFTELIRLHPIPDASYSTLISYIRKYDVLAGDADTNSFLTEAEAMVRYKSKALLYANYFDDLERANYFEALANQEFVQLRKEYNTKTQSPKLRAYYL